jgi:hypothetical protein
MTAVMIRRHDHKMVVRSFREVLSREVLLKGKAQYDLPPFAYFYRSAPLCIENIFNTF